MMNRWVGIVLALTLETGHAPAADWKPAKGPLVTRWAKDVKPDKALPDYPRPQLVPPDWLNLNGVWQLALGKQGEAPPLGKELPERILVPFPVESALSGVMKHSERLWYRRAFAVPAAWAGKRVLLHFGAVDWEATVWVNGKKLGTHRGGYDGFSFDVTDALKKSGPQELVVGVFDPTDAGPQPRGKQVRKPGGIMYTPTTGIWQTVWLEPVPETSIGRLHVVPDIDRGKVRITVETTGVAKGLKVKAVVKDGENTVAAGSGAAGEPLSLDIPKAKLWSPTAPFLYDLRVELLQGEKTVDAVDSYFGMRKISVGKDEKGVTRLLLNNKFVFQFGPLDQGFWPDGIYTAPTDEALKYDIQITKDLGFNMTRKHVKVEPDKWYYWCDKLGLLVWQDMPSGTVGRGGNKDHDGKPVSEEAAQDFERELKGLIDGRRNHPCIVMWVVFNEGWGQYDTKRLTEWTKRYDPSRLVNCASGWNDRKVGDVHDIHAYPGPHAPEPEPARAAVLGEYGGLGLGIEGHSWSGKTWGYRGTLNGADLTRQYERLAGKVWQLKDKPGLSAAVYTQITDVETEANGLLTYDRAVIKVDLGRVKKINQGDTSGIPQVKVVVPTAQNDRGLLWRYTVQKPADGWSKADFDDSSWKEGPAGFGTKGTPGAVVRTVWNTHDIWLRREITLPKGPFKDLLLFIHHDDDAEVYVNGVLAAQLKGYVTEYQEVPLTAAGRAALKPGKNRLAVHCHQNAGGQYIDVGLVEVK